MWFVRKGKNGPQHQKESKETAFAEARSLSLTNFWTYYVLFYFSIENNDYWVMAKYRNGDLIT
jgi:hypothetical protein